MTLSGGLSVESLPGIRPPSEAQNHVRSFRSVKVGETVSILPLETVLCPANIRDEYAHVSFQHVT